MENYKNLSHDSNIVKFQIGEDSIEIEFTDKSRYLYTYKSTGRSLVEQMKKLALRGHGLNSFINQFVGKNFASKN